MLEGSASIRTASLGNLDERKGGEKPTQSRFQCLLQSRKRNFALYWIQEIHRSTFLIIRFPDLNVVSLRPIAIVPATPSTLEGLCGPGQRNGVGSSFELGKTLDHRRLFTSGLLYRFTDATAGKIFGHEALQRPHSFCVYGKKQAETLLCVWQKFGCKVLRA